MISPLCELTMITDDGGKEKKNALNPQMHNK